MPRNGSVKASTARLGMVRSVLAAPSVTSAAVGQRLTQIPAGSASTNAIRSASAESSRWTSTASRNCPGSAATCCHARITSRIGRSVRTLDGETPLETGEADVGGDRGEGREHAAGDDLRRERLLDSVEDQPSEAAGVD